MNEIANEVSVLVCELKTIEVLHLVNFYPFDFNDLLISSYQN
jgi:hypothetical protein